MVEDSLHNIWIGTNNGLFRYDIKADTFAHFLPAAGLALSNLDILPFQATKDELFCVESDSIITTYNIHSFAKESVATITFADSVMKGISHFDEGSNSLWMLRNMVSHPETKNCGLLQISVSDGKRKFYTWDCFKKIPGHSHCSLGIKYDKKRNCIWLNSPDGLLYFTFADKQFHNTDALKDYSLIGSGIDIDLDGRIWLATAQDGLIIYDPQYQSVELAITKDSATQQAVSADATYCIYCDPDGIVWTGS